MFYVLYSTEGVVRYLGKSQDNALDKMSWFRFFNSSYYLFSDAGPEVLNTHV